jgi:hypothetical protein
MIPEGEALRGTPTRGSCASLGFFIFNRRSSELGSALNEKTQAEGLGWCFS